jgi:DNA-binding phage protein
MVKAKIPQKQKKSSENIQPIKIKPDISVQPFSATQELLDENFIGKAIVECLKNNDPDGVIEVLKMYLNTLNTVESVKKANLARSTFYHSLKSKNPTIKTLAKLVYVSNLAIKK